jgi:hypothetical protein
MSPPCGHARLFVHGLVTVNVKAGENGAELYVPAEMPQGWMSLAHSFPTTGDGEAAAFEGGASLGGSDDTEGTAAAGTDGAGIEGDLVEPHAAVNMRPSRTADTWAGLTRDRMWSFPL